jgi:hypothetical protein
MLFSRAATAAAAAAACSHTSLCLPQQAVSTTAVLVALGKADRHQANTVAEGLKREAFAAVAL